MSRKLGEGWSRPAALTTSLSVGCMEECATTASSTRWEQSQQADCCSPRKTKMIIQSWFSLCSLWGEVCVQRCSRPAVPAVSGHPHAPLLHAWAFPSARVHASMSSPLSFIVFISFPTKGLCSATLWECQRGVNRHFGEGYRFPT